MLGNRIDRATGARSFASFEAKYWLPAWSLQGGRPEVQEPQAPWVRVWQARAPQIALFALLLVAVGVVYAQRDRLTRASTRKNKWPVNAFKYSAWVLSIAFVGFGLMAQPSITQVLTWFHALLFRWEWSLFLSDPFIFLFWIFIIVTVFVWGRGLFCGWLCPFGSLSELLYKVGGAVGLKRFQFQLPQTSVTIPAGTSGSASVNLQRIASLAPYAVVVVQSTSRGITVTPEVVRSTGEPATFTINVAPDVAPGRYALTITGATPLGPMPSVTLTVNVTAAP